MRWKTYNPKLLQQSNGLLARGPRRRRPAPGLFPRRLFHHFYALPQHVSLLRLAQRAHKFVSISVQPDLMTFVYDLLDLGREGLDRVRRRKPCCFDVVLVPELEEPVDADGCTKDTAGYVGGVCCRAVAGVYPVGS